MSAFFGSDGSFPFQFAIIFVVIFAVLGGLVLLVRHFSGGSLSAAAKAGSRGRQPRLGIVDIYELDRQRQLILLRRDNVEHLLLVGGPNDVVVERNISRSSLRVVTDEAVRDEDDDHPPSRPEPALPPPPEPIVAPREPAAAPRAAIVPDLKAERRSPGEPAFVNSPAVEPPVVKPTSTIPPPLVPSQPNPPPPRREAPSLPGRILSRTPPPLVNPKPDVASERSRAPDPTIPIPAAPVPVSPSALAAPDFEAAFAAALAAPAAMSVSVPVPPPAEAAPAAKVDAAILSDMARQLEEALRRPDVTPTPVIPQADLARDLPDEIPEAPSEPAREEVPQASPVSTPEPAADTGHPAEGAAVTADFPIVRPAPAEAEQPTDPMAAAMASAAEPSTDGDGLFEDIAPPAKPIPSIEPDPAPAPPASPPARPAPSPASSNPFSVEEIEAEFARLLGRPLDKPLDRKN